MLAELPEDLGSFAVFDTETRDRELKIRGPGWAYKNGGYIAGVAVKSESGFREYLDLAHPGPKQRDPEQVRRWLTYQLKKNNLKKIFANAPYDLGWFAKSGIEYTDDGVEDVLVQAPLVYELHFEYGVDFLGKHYLGIGKDESGLEKWAEENGHKKKEIKALIADMPAEIAGHYALVDADVELDLWHLYNKEIEEQDLSRVYRLELDLIPLLIEMRRRGVRVDLERAHRIANDFKVKEEAALLEIKRASGIEPESIWSAADLAPVLDAVGVAYALTVKTKKPSITAPLLEAMQHPVGKAIRDARKYNRARSTFIESHIFGHHEDGRVFPVPNQLKSSNEDEDTKGTVTGRFSYQNPSIQQVPKRDEEIGPLIRSIYLPEVGEIWGSFDYSSQEPRVLVHFAELAKVRGGHEIAERYREDPALDFHQYTADNILHFRPDFQGGDRKKARKVSKPIGLGLAYGMGGGKLCRQLGLPTEMKSFRKGGKVFEYEGAGPEGQEVLDAFNDGAPFIGKLSKYASKLAKQRGYVMTPTGRRFRFPIIGGERMFLHKALNRIIQGTSACMTKTAMVVMWREGIVPAFPVHDELDKSLESWNCHEAKRIEEIMCTAFPLNIPILVDAEFGRSWGEVSKEHLKEAA